MSLKILGIHGLGKHTPGSWEQTWIDAIQTSLPVVDATTSTEFEFIPFNYDRIYEQIEITAWEGAAAFAKLAGSGIASTVEGWFGQRRVARGFGDSFSNFLNWQAGYIVAWLEDEDFREAIRKLLLQAISDTKPDVILAHSLGSLISYDALSDEKRWRQSSILREHLPKTHYVTLGSQIGNRFVRRNLTPGRIAPLEVQRWTHLYNENDAVFTAPIRLPDVSNFTQISTPFDIQGWLDHNAEEYIKHPNAIAGLWSPLVLEVSRPRVARAMAKSRKSLLTAVEVARSPRRRALLVGINDYPNKKDQLHGCVNDVYLMSSVLQECGFEPEDIRVVLNGRATARGILERMHWLLEDAKEGDEIVFYYSGHGAQLPTYGAGDHADRMDETLVPFDFDWSPETCITDDVICDLYSQLPWKSRFAMIFDCCHSGGIHRDTGVAVRGLVPPDDIRHRAMKWDAETEMWSMRRFPRLSLGFTDSEESERQFMGASAAVNRLGRGMPLRGMSDKEYDHLKESSEVPVGPYLPLILEACQEHEYAYEYRHGVESYGAFTFTLAKLLRQRKRITFADLVESTTDQLDQLGYEQRPCVLGPDATVNSLVPWKPKSQSKPVRKKTRKKK